MQEQIQRWGIVLAATLALQFLSVQVSPYLPLPTLFGYSATFLFVAAVSIVVSSQAPVLKGKNLLWALLPLAALLALAFTKPALGLATAMTTAASLLVLGSLLGGSIGGQIEHPGHLLLVAWVSSLADAWSVLSAQGISAQLVESEVFLSVVAISWPILGTDVIQPVLGAGDIVVLSLYLAAARELGLGTLRPALGLGAAFLVILLALVVLEIALPALPFLGLGFVLSCPAVWNIRAEDRRSALLGVGGLTLLFVLLWLRG